jgi:hypothetical protein
MNHSLTQRAFSAVVAALTIVWAAGVAAFAVPQTASAANPGDRIRGTSFSTVYYYGYDGARYAFPNEKTYDTWFNGFNGVQTISDSALENITLGGNVVYRPGSRWIKITSAAETYAVARDGMIHWIESEAVASALAGSAWNTTIDDVADVFFTDYTTGMSLSSPRVWNGALFTKNGNQYVSWEGSRHMLSSAGRSANNLEDRFFLAGNGIDDSALTSGADITGFNCDLSNASQAGTCSTPVQPTGGNLSVSVASSTTPAAIVPDTASRVYATSWSMTAAQATTLTSMTVSLGGLANTSDIANVYLYEGNARLTDGRTFNSSTRTATFAGLNVAFTAGQTRTLSAVVDMNGGGGNRTFRVGLASATDVGTNGTVSGSFPAWGNTHTTSEATLGDVTIEATGPSLVNPSVGSQDHTIARFKLDAGTEEDVEVRSVTLEIRRAADHSDYKLFQGSTQVATGTVLSRDLVLFNFTSPLVLEEGASRNFSVTADIGGKIGDTIQTRLRNVADLNVVGRTFGFGVEVDNDYDTAQEVSIEGGKVTLSFVGPNDADVRVGTRNHKFLEFNLTAEEWAEVEDVTFTVARSSGTNLTARPLRNFRLINAANNQLIAGSLELSTTGNATTQTLTFTDNFYLTAGQTLRLAVVADVDKNAANDGDVFSVSLASSSALNIENADRDAITDIVPSSGVAGKNQTVIDAGLTLSRANTPNGTVSAVRGSSNVEVAAFSFEASEGDSVRVSSVDVTLVGQITATAVSTAMTNVQLRDRIAACSLVDRSNNNALVAGPRSIVSAAGNGGTLNFTNMAWTVPGGATRTLAVRCNIADIDPFTTTSTDTTRSATFSAHLLSGAVSATETTTGDNLDSTGYPVNGANHGAAGVRVSILGEGTLNVAVDSGRPAARLVLAGTNPATPLPVSTFRFDATNEDYRVRTLTIVDAANASDSPISSVTITYPTQTGTASRTVEVTGNEARFANLDMYVTRNTTARVFVSAVVSAHRRDNGFADSNDRIRLEIASDTGSQNRFETLGVGSSVTNKIFDGTNASREHVVRETIPTLALSSATASGVLANGDRAVLTFNVQAASTEDVIWDGGLFQVNGNGDWNTCDNDGNHNLRTISLVRIEGGNRTTLTGSLDPDDLGIDFSYELHEANLAPIDAENCTDEVASYIRITFADGEGEVIPAGQTRSFELRITVREAAADNSLQVSIPSENAVPFSASSATIAGNQPSASATVIDVSDASVFRRGMIIRHGVAGERMLVTAVNTNTDKLTVVRGYAGTTAAGLTNGTNVNLSGTPFLWQDDGTNSVSDASEYWGAYLVNTLPVTGNDLVW